MSKPAESRLTRLKGLRELPELRRDPVSADVMAQSAQIVQSVREGGEAALREQAQRFGELAPGDALAIEADELHDALESLPPEEQALLEGVAGRIESFAREQLRCLRELDIELPAGRAGHKLLPVHRVACYAPGGGYPLPSTVLMTALPARVAGVREVVVASPRPTKMTLAAAALAGASRLYPVGGAQSIGALAYGAGPIAPVDMIVGPGNAWVTAAKLLVAGRVAIDLPGGPSELLVIADRSADAATVAADLLAQAEHDPLALPVVISPFEDFLDEVDDALARQLAELPTAKVAGEAVAGGYSVLVADLAEAAAASDQLAPEHLQLHLRDPDALIERLQHYGALFIGQASAEVLGDYGAGPNHVLPTGGSARAFSGLSVFHFLRSPTWLRLEPGELLERLARDSARLARHEGLEGHARAAEARLGS